MKCETCDTSAENLVYERPGGQTEDQKDVLSALHVTVERYLPCDFTPELLSRLSQELTPLTCEGFMRDEITPELIEDVESHLSVSDRIVVARDTDLNPVAFITTSMHNFSIITGENGLLYHLEGIIVKPDYHGSGLSKRLITDDIKDSKATHLGFHTQNGRMRSLGIKIANINDQDSCQYAQVIDTYCQRGNNDVGRYGGQSLYGDQNKFSVNAIKEIDWQKGDAIVCIGPIRPEILI